MHSSFLVDTDVFIDFFRDSELANQFLSACFPEVYVSVVTVAELFSGVRGRRERELLANTLASCKILDVTKEIAELGGAFRMEYRKSYSLDLPDALIAATAKTYNLPLATLHKKHYPMFPNLKAPYKKA